MHRSKLWRLNNEKWLTIGTRGLAELGTRYAVHIARNEGAHLVLYTHVRKETHVSLTPTLKRN